MDCGNFKIQWPSENENHSDDSDNMLLKASQEVEENNVLMDKVNSVDRSISADSDEELIRATQEVEENIVFHYSDISDWESESKDTQKLTFEKKLDKTERQFGQTVTESELNAFESTRLPANTVAKSKWAMKAFENWQNYRRKMSLESGGESFDLDVLQMSNETLNNALRHFIVEIRKLDGEEYRGQTLYELIVAIQYHLRIHGKLVNLLEDNVFLGMRNVLDAKMKQLSKSGIGLEKKRADVISEAHEETLWAKNILGSETPKQLMDTIFYLIGLNFALRAGKEHRSLRFGARSQLTLLNNESGIRYLQYNEDVSKTNQGGLKHRKRQKKTVRAYENLDNSSRCIVKLYEKYIGLRPQKTKTDAFYLQPSKFPSTKSWFNNSPIGVHTLQNLVKNMCHRAGFNGNFSNHSLRATAATRLYNAGV